MSSSFSLLLVLVCVCSSASPFKKEEEDKDKVGRGRPLHDNIMERMKKIRESLAMKGQDEEYKRYWEELIANNPDLARRFQEHKAEDIAANVGDRFAHRNGEVRSHIDELQRRNIEELRELHRQKVAGDSNDIRRQRGPHMTDREMEEKIREHQRIQEQLDHARREDFKNFEMKVEHMRRQKLKEMDETQRLREEAKLKKLADERKIHERLLHPASKEQLEDVWKTDDGFKDEQFDIKTFFHLHDTNGDGTLDIHEIEALFVNEVRKYYGDDFNDRREAHEDMARMREHVMSEVDRDHDSLVTLDEFTRYANTDLFNIKEEWKPVGEDDEHKEFTDDEFKQYENEFEEDDDYDYDANGNLIRKPKAYPTAHEPDNHQAPTDNPNIHEEKATDHHENKPTDNGVPLDHEAASKGEQGLPNHPDIPVGGANRHGDAQPPIVEKKHEDQVNVLHDTAPPANDKKL